MEINKLYEASLKGSVKSLTELLTANPHLHLDTRFTGNRRTPLHIAAMCGHVKFAEELMRMNPRLTRDTDSHGFTPLHLASARRSTHMVEKLLEANNQDVCLEKDQDGRIPLHLAAMKDQVKNIDVLLEKKPEAIDHILNDQRETILHLCVKHNNLKALKSLVKHLNGAKREDSITVNSTDEQGNTILHLAAKMKQMKCMKYLMESKDFEIDTNAINKDNRRARDMLTQKERDQLEIGFYKNEEKTSKDWIKDRMNMIMVVATLIAGVAFQAGMNPPGGVFQEDSYVNSGESPVLFSYYLGAVANIVPEYTFFGKYLKDPLITRDYKMINSDNFLNQLLDLDALKLTTNIYSYVRGKAPGIVLEHDDWNSTIYIYKRNGGSDFFPYLIRYAGTPILAYRNPKLYIIFITSTAVAFIASITVIILVITGFIYEDSTMHQIRILVVLMTLSTLALFLSYIAAFASMSPPFYNNWKEIYTAIYSVIGAMWVSLILYPLFCQLKIRYFKYRIEIFSWFGIVRKEVLIDQFQKEIWEGIDDQKHMIKTYIKFIPVYGSLLIFSLVVTIYYPSLIHQKRL